MRLISKTVPPSARSKTRYTGRHQVPARRIYDSEHAERLASWQDVARSLPWYRKPYAISRL